jgi:uncharacterized membrane protein HdeD (DUF308 family)
MSNVSFFDHARNRFRAGLAEIDHKRGWYFALGVLLVILGFVAAGSAVATTMVSVMLFGGLLIIAGISLTVLSFVTGSWSGFFMTLAAGVLLAIAGFAMLNSPPSAATAITMMVGAILIAAGFFRAIASIVMQFPSWGWALVSGIASIIIGGLLITNWQNASLYFLGLYIGIDLIIHGISWIAFSTSVHSLARQLNISETDLPRAA